MSHYVTPSFSEFFCIFESTRVRQSPPESAIFCRIPPEYVGECTVLNVQGVTGDLLANLTINIKQLINTSGDETSFSSRGVSYCKSDDNQSANRLAHLAEKSETSLEEVTKMEDTEQGDTKEPEGRWDLLWLLDPMAGSNLSHPGIEQPDITKTFEPTLLTRKTNPHNPARVEAILNEITLGQDLTVAQCESICLTIAEYAECITLSMSEVKSVEGASLRLEIP